MTDRTGATVWTYDDADRLTSLTTPQGATAYAYNDADQRTTMTLAGVGQTTYGYDAYGRPSSVLNAHNETTTWQYDSAGRVSRQTFASTAYEEYGYDALSRLNSVTVRNSGGTAIESQSMVYDAASNLATRVHNGVAAAYGYDAIDQLVSEVRPGYSGSYTYDSNGNRLSRTVNGVLTTYSYDDADKLLSHTTGGNTTSYTYDAAGRPTLIGASRLHYWTYEGEMSEVWNAGAPGYKDTFAYNGLSTRVSKTEQKRMAPPSAGTTTAFVRDGAGVTAPVIADSFATYTPGVSERRGGISTFQHSGIKNNDAQSNVPQVVSATREYDAFGNLASSSGTFSGPFGYGGPFGYQESAFHPYKLLGHRYYDPTTGRFLTRDRAKDGRNWYAYCESNPLTRADASGQDWHDPMVVYVDPRFDGEVIAVGEPAKGRQQTSI